MLRKETNRQWGVDIAKLNRSFREGTSIQLNNRERDNLLRVLNRANSKIDRLSMQCVAP